MAQDMPKSILGLVHTQWFDFIGEISLGGLCGSGGLSAETVRYNISAKYGGSAGFWLPLRACICLYGPVSVCARKG
jgi:hypothetical protein